MGSSRWSFQQSFDFRCQVVFSHEGFSVFFMHFTAMAHNGEHYGNCFQTVLQSEETIICVPFCKEVLKVTCSKLSQISEMASAVTISGYPWTRAHILLRHWSFTSWLFGNILIHCIIFEEAWLFSANIRRGRSMLHSSSRSFKGLMMVAAAPSAFYRPFHWKLHGLLLTLITKTVPPQVGEVYQYYLMLRLLSEMHYHFCDCQWQYLRGSHPVAEE